MKKLLTLLAITAISSSVLAHTRYERRCQTTYDRRGHSHTRCTTIRIDDHHHHDGYGDGFFDGMLASSYLTLTTSDILDGDNKMDALKNEVSLTLSLLNEGVEDAISQEIRSEMEAIRLSDESLQDASDADLLEAILLAE